MGPGPGGLSAESWWTRGSWWRASEWGLSEAVTDKTPSRDQRVNNKQSDLNLQMPGAVMGNDDVTR